MNKLLLGLLVGLALGGGVAWTLLHHDEASHDEHAAKGEKADEGPLHLNAEKRAAAGILLAAPQRKPIGAEVTAQGRVLDPSPLITLLAEIEAARATQAAAEKEFARVQQLQAQDGNASQQAVEAAEADVLRARAQRLGLDARLMTGWGAALAGRSDLSKLVGALAHQEIALARLDVAGAGAIAEPPKVRVAPLAHRDAVVDAEVLGPAPAADPQTQGASYLVLLRARATPPGTALLGWFTAEGAPTEAWWVPAAAIVYHDGSPWVYVLGARDTFERERIEIIRATAHDAAVNGELEQKSQVVVRGAQQLLSAELQAGTKD